MRIVRGGGVSAGETKEGFLRPAQHGPELAAEDAVGAANDFLQHSLLNSLAIGSLTKMRVQRRHVQGASSTRTSRLRLIVFTLEELRHERNGPIV